MRDGLNIILPYSRQKANGFNYCDTPKPSNILLLHAECAKYHENSYAYLRTSLPSLLHAILLYAFILFASSLYNHSHIASWRRSEDSKDNTPSQCEETRDSKKAAAGQVPRHSILHTNARKLVPYSSGNHSHPKCATERFDNRPPNSRLTEA